MREEAEDARVEELLDTLLECDDPPFETGTGERDRGRDEVE